MTHLFLPTDALTGESLVAGESVAAEFRDALVRAAIRAKREYAPVYEIVGALRQMGVKLTPILAENFWQSDLAAWLEAYDFAARQLPDWLVQHLAETAMPPPPGTPWQRGIFAFDEPEVRFPKIEQAAQSLIERNILDRDEFDRLDRDAKARAFTVAGGLSDDAIGEIRDTLVDLTFEGPTLPEFRARIRERVDTGALAPHHVENVYRTNLQAAYRDGRESLISNPIVSSVFPYQEYVPIHDGRVREEHLALGSLGLDGTGVYRRDDPFWDAFTPPISFNCRCSVIPMTLEKAASKGVTEAREWLETGVPPRNPEYRLTFIPFPPEPGFGQRSGRRVAA